MTYMEAWRWITSRWNCVAWIGIPESVNAVLGINPNGKVVRGMCHGQLVTQMAAKGMNDFINRMNAPRGV